VHDKSLDQGVLREIAQLAPFTTEKPARQFGLI
jgi:hypothetical protein